MRRKIDSYLKSNFHGSDRLQKIVVTLKNISDNDAWALRVARGDFDFIIESRPRHSAIQIASIIYNILREEEP